MRPQYRLTKDMEPKTKDTIGSWPKRSPLPARTKPLKRTAIKTVFEKREIGGWFPVKRTPVRNKRKGKRRVSVVRDRGYMDWLHDRRCVACEVVFEFRPRVSDPAHTAKTNGMKSKGDDSSCIPLCREHHQEMDGHRYIKIATKAQFAEKYGLDLAAIAAAHYARFKQETGN